MAKNEEDPTIREALSEAFTATETAELGDDTDTEDTTDETSSTDTQAEGSEGEDETEDQEDEDSEAGESDDESESDDTDDTDEPDTDKAAKDSVAAKDGSKKAPVTKAPGSWTPAAREHWARLDPAVQTEINRREREIHRGLSDAAESKKTAAEFKEVVAPFQHFIQAENSTPMQAVKNMMQTAAVFRVGTAKQKADTAAHIIKNFGIDIQMLDDILSGQQVDDPVNRAVAERMAPMERYVQELQARDQQRSAATEGTVVTELEAFANDPKNEFFHDVRNTMADMLDVASKQGKTLDLQTAYDRAIMLHDDIAGVVSARKIREQAAKRGAPARRAKKKRVSIQGAPNVGSRRKRKESLRGDIVAAYDSLQD
jgi:hypothetical protein